MVCSSVALPSASAFAFEKFAPMVMAALYLATTQASHAADQRKLIPVTVQRVASDRQQVAVELTGAIAARNVSDAGFRISGRIVSRDVEVGDRVREGQVLARLEADVQNADVSSAEAAVTSADATFRQKQADLDRQISLLENGVGTQALVDDAEEQLQAATASQTTARANLGIAKDNLGNTILKASVNGVVVARNVEAGQVVEAAQTVYSLAEDGERDAVFDIYETLLTRPLSARRAAIRLVSNPSVSVDGTVREVSPVIDAKTGTVRVKIALPKDLPPGLTLGAAVTGTAQFDAGHVVSVPWTALSRENGQPVVWVVNDTTKSASAKPVSISRYRSNDVLIGEGLSDGDMVVTSGIPFLTPGIAVEPRLQGEKG